MFSKKIFTFIMSVVLLSICSTTNAFGPANFHSDPEVLMNLIKMTLDKDGGSPITISNGRYYTEDGVKHMVANFDNNAKNKIDFSLVSDGSVFVITIKEDFSAKRKFSEESRESMLISVLSSMRIVVAICDIFEFKLRPKEIGGLISRDIVSPILNEMKAGRTPEPKMTYINGLYNSKSELCDLIIAFNYEQGGITYVMLKSA